MPRHLVSDAHEWIIEISTVPIFFLCKTTAKGTGLGCVALIVLILLLCVCCVFVFIYSAAICLYGASNSMGDDLHHVQRGAFVFALCNLSLLVTMALH